VVNRGNRVLGNGAESNDNWVAQGRRHLPYEQRPQYLGLIILKERRTRDDLIEAYKIMTGRETVERELFFQLPACKYNLRGHSMKLSKQRASLDVQLACGKRVETVTSRGCGCYVCSKPVQVPSGQVLVEIMAVKSLA